MQKRFLFVLSLYLVAASCLQAQTADRLLKDVTSIANAAGNAERRAAITAVLDSEGIPYELEEFVDRRMRMGTNIIVTLPAAGEKTILVGGHYDRVGVGQGALDNGASCAVLLELLRSVKAKPLASHPLRVVFFDLEEGGLSGSQAHLLGSSARPLPAYGINLDVFAYGDAVFATASNADGSLAAALVQAGSELSLPVRVFTPAEYPASDHRSMMQAGVETLSVSLFNAPEIDPLVGFITGQATEVPPVLATIHTPGDTLETVKPVDIEKAVPVLERVLRIVDQN